LYTYNDLEGVGCCIVARLAFGEKVEIRYITELFVDETNEQGLNEFAKSGGKVKLIDHHKTSLHLGKYPWGMVQVTYENGKQEQIN
jgi:oligoribonuclease NrnB/cAMP/cGMP phosphodiesterase (DHH superfamily)